MNSAKPGRPADDWQEPAADVESEIRRLVRREEAGSDRRPQPDPRDGIIATEVNSLIERVSVTSASEVAKLISELQSLRDFLQSEGKRIQREIGGYVHLNEAAMNATKTIAESIPPWKNRALTQ